MSHHDGMHSNREPWKGLVAGLVGGLTASWAMNRFQSALKKATAPKSREQNSSQQQQSSEPATVKAAQKISTRVLHRSLDDRQKKVAEPLMHYGFGSAVGGIYGAATEVVPQVKKAAGLPFGTAVFIGADEIAVPAFGLSKAPAEYPLSTHAQALAAHLVYGATTELVRRVVRAVL